VTDNKRIESNFMKIWNKYLGKIDFFYFDPKKLLLTSYLKMFFGESHKSHTYLLEKGIDAMTLKLYLSENEDSKSVVLSDYTKLLTHSYHAYASNDRHLESTYFFYSVIDSKTSLVKAPITDALVTFLLSILWAPLWKLGLLRIKPRINFLINAFPRLIKIGL